MNAKWSIVLSVLLNVAVNCQDYMASGLHERRKMKHW